MKIIVNGKELLYSEAGEISITSRPMFSVIKKGDLYHHEIKDIKTSRVVKFSSTKDYSSILEHKDNKIEMNGINVFDGSKILSEIDSLIRGNCND